MRAEPMIVLFCFVLFCFCFFFFSQYGEIYPDNLWVFTPAVNPTLTLRCLYTAQLVEISRNT